MMQGFSNKYQDLHVKVSFYLFSLLISLFSQSLLISGSLTKIGQTFLNQVLMVVATKPCSLLFDLYTRIHMNRTLMIADTKSRSDST